MENLRRRRPARNLLLFPPPRLSRTVHVASLRVYGISTYCLTLLEINKMFFVRSGIFLKINLLKILKIIYKVQSLSKYVGIIGNEYNTVILRRRNFMIDNQSEPKNFYRSILIMLLDNYVIFNRD